MGNTKTESKFSAREFTLLCIGGFLLSIAYGVTFLIPALVGNRGGDEALAGLIISAATVSTVMSVLASGHIADAIGSARAAAVSGIFLALSALGFAVVPSAGLALTAVGFILGIGWGAFYTLGPILVAAIIEPERRIKFFALLSGSMMSGIGMGPIIGRVAEALSMPIESAFIFASLTSLIGGALYYRLHRRLIATERNMPQMSRISFVAVRQVMRSKAIFAIIMVGVGGAIFGSLSSFQTSYAKAYGFDYSLFFIGFTVVAITCRLLLAGYVTRRDPFYTLAILTSLTLIAIGLFTIVTTSAVIYLAASVILGIGYGLTYSVINGLAANEAPDTYIPQSLLLFSLAYFIGIFGFPLIAGVLIVSYGIHAMMVAILLLALLSQSMALYRTASEFIKTRKNNTP